MNELERMKLLSSARKLKEREDTPAPFEDPYSDMTPDEKSKMIMELVASRERDAERIRRDEARIDALLSKVDELLSLQKAAIAAEKELDDYKQQVSNLLSKITALEERLKVRNKNLYGCKSQKGIRKKRGTFLGGMLYDLTFHTGETIESFNAGRDAANAMWNK